LRNGLANTRASTASDQALEIPIRRAICAAHTVIAADRATVTTPSATTGRRSPVTSPTNRVTTARRMVFSGEVAVFAVSVGISPQCRCAARFRTKSRLM
jgi:hypothetical protein